MENSNRYRRVAAATAALAMLGGVTALWLSADAQKVHANVPPLTEASPVEREQPSGAVSAGDAGISQYLAAPVAPTRSREEKRFARADRDDDGRITQAEFLAQRRRNFDKLDVNGDGRLSFEEYAASGIAKFRKADSNSDHQLSAAEFATTAAKAARPRLAATAACPPSQTARTSNAADTGAGDDSET